MKRIYIQPEILVVRLQHQNIICSSPVAGIQSEEGIQYGGAGGGTEGSIEVFTRQSNSVWDEEW